VEPRTKFDVIVVGDGLGASTAAISAARMGASTLLLSPTWYFGGQAGAAGVTTMDEGGGRYLFRRAGVYGELIGHLRTVYGEGPIGGCYFSEETVCPEPQVVDSFLRSALAKSGVELRILGAVDGLLQTGGAVSGVIADGVELQAQVVIDGSEWSDLYPLVEGLDFEVGNGQGCVQDATWLAIRSWYPNGAPEQLVPPADAIDELRALYGAETLNEWLARFRSLVALPTGEGGGDIVDPANLPWTVATETRYRAMADRRFFPEQTERPPVTRTGVNFANDSQITVEAFGSPEAFHTALRRALHVTYAFLWYLRWELGVSDWGVANDLGYDGAVRLFWDDLVPDGIEANLPPIPYVREGRRLRAVQNISAEDVADPVRGRDRFPDQVMLGGYLTDFHGCPPETGTAGYGLFEVPLGVFIPEQVDGFLPGLARAAGVDRVAASSLRTQPEEAWGGQVVGFLAGLAVREGVQPREVPAAEVQEQLAHAGLISLLP
jgi:hypothetical protein